MFVFLASRQCVHELCPLALAPFKALEKAKIEENINVALDVQILNGNHGIVILILLKKSGFVTVLALSVPSFDNFLKLLVFSELVTYTGRCQKNYYEQNKDAKQECEIL